MDTPTLRILQLHNKSFSLYDYPDCVSCMMMSSKPVVRAIIKYHDTAFKEMRVSTKTSTKRYLAIKITGGPK